MMRMAKIVLVEMVCDGIQFVRHVKSPNRTAQKVLG